MRRRYLLQYDFSDCGAACLTMICAYYGLKTSMTNVRELIGTDRNGTSGYGLVKGFKELGFEVKVVRAVEKYFDRTVPMPCIANVTTDFGDHYVVIYGMKKGRLIVADPAKGKCVITQEAFVKSWTGVLFLASPGDNFAKGNQRKVSQMVASFLKLIRHSRGEVIPQNRGRLTINWQDLSYQKRVFVWVTILSALGTVLGLASSFYYKNLIDKVMPSGDFGLLKLVVCVFALIGLLNIVVETLRSYLLTIACDKIDVALVTAYYGHVLNLPMNFFDSRDIGEVLSRMDDAYEIKSAIATLIVEVGLNVITAIGCGILLCLISVPLFLMFFLMLVIYAGIVYGFRKKMNEKTRDLMEESTRLRSLFIESVSGIETVKALGAREEFGEKFQQRMVNCLDKEFNVMQLTTRESLLINLVSVLGNIFVLGIGIYYVMSGVLSFGAFLTFESLVAFFLSSAGQLVHTQVLLQTTWINFCRLYEIMELRTEQERQNSEPKKLGSLFLPIDMTDVHFRYGSRKLALDGLNMRIEAGEKVAIVGPSGAGKSTISKLLMNFYAPESGEIHFGEHNIKNLDVDWFRSMIAYLPQDAVLFKGSLEENIKQKSKSVPQDEFVKVCEMCRLDEFVKELPGGYSFKITEQGHNFSGGQKQRIALARALIQKFDLLIMDEATNGMDSITEHLIMDVVLGQLQSTVVLIAHRLACAQHCQKIFVVDGGRVVESGSHKTLMAGDGLYRKMMDQYSL